MLLWRTVCMICIHPSPPLDHNLVEKRSDMYVNPQRSHVNPGTHIQDSLELRALLGLGLGRAALPLRCCDELERVIGISMGLTARPAPHGGGADGGTRRSPSLPAPWNLHQQLAYKAYKT